MGFIKLLNFDLHVSNTYKFAKAMAEFIRKLPRMPLPEDLNQMELCSRVLDPFLHEYLMIQTEFKSRFWRG